jgi:hypothetical protein
VIVIIDTVMWKICWPKYGKREKDGKNGVCNGDFMFRCLLYILYGKWYYSDQIKDEEMGKVCEIYERGEKCLGSLFLEREKRSLVEVRRQRLMQGAG